MDIESFKIYYKVHLEVYFDLFVMFASMIGVPYTIIWLFGLPGRLRLSEFHKRESVPVHLQYEKYYKDNSIPRDVIEYIIRFIDYWMGQNEFDCKYIVPYAWVPMDKLRPNDSFDYIAWNSFPGHNVDKLFEVVKDRIKFKINTQDFDDDVRLCLNRRTIKDFILKLGEIEVKYGALDITKPYDWEG